MCKRGTEKEIKIDGKLIKVDACIAEEIDYLNRCGIKTCSSCCGHFGQYTGQGERLGLEFPSALIGDDSSRKKAIELGYYLIRWQLIDGYRSSWEILLKGKSLRYKKIEKANKR